MKKVVFNSKSVILLIVGIFALAGCTGDSSIEEKVSTDSEIEVDMVEQVLDDEQLEEETIEVLEERLENWVYYAVVEGEPAIIINDVAHTGSRSTKDTKQTPIEAQLQGQKALMEIHPEAYHFASHKAQDTNTLFFAIFNEDRVVEMFKYDNDIAVPIFKGTDIETGGNYPIFKDIIDDRYIAFTVIPCWDCGPPYPLTSLVDLETGLQKSIGRVVDVKWKNRKGDFQYKPYVVESCETSYTGNCTINEEEIDWVEGNIDSVERNEILATFISEEYGFQYQYPEAYTNDKTWDEDLENGDALNHRIISPEDKAILRERDDITHDGFGITLRVISTDESAKEYYTGRKTALTTKQSTYKGTNTKFINYRENGLGDGINYYVADLDDDYLLIVSTIFLNIDTSPELVELLDSISIN